MYEIWKHNIQMFVTIVIIDHKVWIIKAKQKTGGYRANPVGIYLFKVNNRNTRTRCEYVQRY